MKKYVVITVINREISTFFTDSLELAQSRMRNTFKDYLEDENLDTVDYGENECDCWITGNYNNVDIAIHEVK